MYLQIFKKTIDGEMKRIRTTGTGTKKKKLITPNEEENLWRGPYTIVNKIGPVNYRIPLKDGSQNFNVHYNHLKLC